MIRLKAFGTPTLRCDETPLGPGATQRRPLALLALLAVAGERGLSRDKLIGCLWPEREEERARHVLAQTLYALRRALPGAEVVLGTSELRLNPEAIRSDVTEFESALAAGDVEQAAALYTAPFLDGFYLNDAPEFERWAERERVRLAQRARAALERAARQAAARGDAQRAVEWWRSLARLDPLDARAALGLMEALAAAGDRAGALQHARVHEVLLREELDVAPDPAVSALAERLRTSAPPAVREARPADPPAPGEAPGAPAVAAAPATTAPPGATPAVEVGARPMGGEVAQGSARPRQALARRRVVVSVATSLVVLVPSALTILAHRTGAAPGGLPVVAVGAVRDYSGEDTSGMARALTDMLSTNLARLPNLRVVSNARMYELVGQTRAAGERAAQLAGAARQAGAGEIVEGTLYRLGSGVIRFDVRRVELATGAIRKAYSVEGADPFELVDRATGEIAGDLGPEPPAALHVADVTTRSLVGYRFYEEGLQAFYQQNDLAGARRLFLAALGEDSTFAMAEYYAANCEYLLGIPSGEDRYVRAARLAERATERERLLIQAMAADHWNRPSYFAMAETLAARYPTEPDAHLALGQGLVWAGDFLASVPHLRRVVAMDSLSLRGATISCRACEALNLIVIAYWLADSIPAAERSAREWTRLQPGSRRAWGTLAGMLVYGGRDLQAREAIRMERRLEGSEVSLWQIEVIMDLRSGDFAAADSILERRMREEPASEAAWYRTFSLRYQGRLREALALARRMPKEPGVAPPSSGAVAEAIVLADMGRSREAAQAFEGIAAAIGGRPELRARAARDQAWNLTQAATALAAAGDTATVARLAERVRQLGAMSLFGRDPRIHHYVRGLLLRARGKLPEAAAEFRRGIFSLTDGYTRNSYELARTLLALHRPAEAIAVLQPAFRGSMQGSNTYITHTELHELLGQAFEAAGQPDSALAHYEYVARAWAGADPPLRARGDRARARLGALRAGR